MQKNLNHHAVSFGTRLIGPKPTANKVKQYQRRKEQQGVFELMEWPPQISDVNIIEQIWDHLDHEKNKIKPKYVEEL